MVKFYKLLFYSRHLDEWLELYQTSNYFSLKNLVYAKETFLD